LPPIPAPPETGCPQLHRPAATGRRRRSLTSTQSTSASRRTGGMTHPVERLHGGMVGWGGAGWLGGDASTTTVEREKNSVAIASNESFSGWTKTVTDPWLCAAIVDRLTYGGNIIETGTQSYRLAATLAHRTAG